MIIKVSDYKNLKKFVYFPKTLYSSSKEFTPPIYSSVLKELKERVLKAKDYTALLYIKDGKALGRILYTVNTSKQLNKQIGYFSYFDFVNDKNVVKSLSNFMINELKGKVDYVEGSFCPYDPDTRRGVLVKGFNEPHTFLTSYNFTYYQTLLEECGFIKAYDTYTVKILDWEDAFLKSKRIAELVNKRYKIKVDNLNFKNIDRDLKDVHLILNEATNELIYQDAPSMELIESFVKSLKFFIEPKLVKIAREQETDTPIGFSLTIKDVNEILKKTNGKINLFKFLSMKNKVKRCRGMLQYVIPKYQNKGVIASLFYETGKTMKELNLEYFEGGTIMETNPNSWQPFVNMGGEISKIYRIYGKEV